MMTTPIFRGEKAKPIVVTVLADGKELQLEVDTGASVSIISNITFRELWEGDRTLRESTVVLHSYANQVINVLGELDVTVAYGDHAEEDTNVAGGIGKGSKSVWTRLADTD